MRTDELLDEYAVFMEKWNAFYNKCFKNSILHEKGVEWMQEFHDCLGSAGIYLEDTGVMLTQADEDLKDIDQDAIIGAWQEAEFERKMEEGIVKAETSFEEDAHTYMPGDELY